MKSPEVKKEDTEVKKEHTEDKKEPFKKPTIAPHELTKHDL